MIWWKFSTNCMRNVSSFWNHQFSYGIYKQDQSIELDQMYLLSAKNRESIIAASSLIITVTVCGSPAKYPVEPSNVVSVCEREQERERDQERQRQRKRERVYCFRLVSIRHRQLHMHTEKWNGGKTWCNIKNLRPWQTVTWEYAQCSGSHKYTHPIYVPLNEEYGQCVVVMFSVRVWYRISCHMI